MVEINICHLGCGNKKLAGAIGVDIIKLPGVDIIQDLDDKPWKLLPSRFDEVHAYHVLEHLHDTLNSMEEIWRISNNEAMIYINVPHFSSPNAFVDPTHVSFFALDTLNYFTEESDLNFYTKVRFKIISKRLEFDNRIFNWIFNLPKIKYFWEVHVSRILPAKEIKYVLRTIK